MSVNKLFEVIKRGKEGRNIGISTGLPTIDSIIYGIQRKYLYVVAADQGGGKTSFAIDIFVYNLFKNITVPLVGLSIPERIFNRVLLPLPDGPHSARNSPLLISRLMLLSASTFPAPAP